MSVEHSNELGNLTSTNKDSRSAKQLAEELNLLADQLRASIPQAAKQGKSFDQTERSVRDALRNIGCQAMQLFVSLQGDGDLGEQIQTDDGTILHRSDKKTNTQIRSIFGLHHFYEFVYARGKNQSIELRPLSARMQSPPERWSLLLEEISQVLYSSRSGASLEAFGLMSIQDSVDRRAATGKVPNPRCQECVTSLGREGKPIYDAL